MDGKGLETVSTSGMTEVQKDFLKHLQDSERVIFSAPFGVGKTYFLKEFFDQPQVQEKCEVFTIHPVNYCTADNKDIFEIIKYDLIFQLVFKQIVSKDYTYEWDYSKLSEGVLKFAIGCANTVLNIVSGLKLDAVDKAKAFRQLCKEFAECAPKHKDGDADNTLLDYLFEMEGMRGTFLEDDMITDIIREKINQINKEGKETVLVIEDLDRLDPAHMFRLLNIFSAHDDCESGKNKFGFSKVMFVCDLDNVKKIYRHFYGPNTDFDGYINKFYDTEPYEFGNFEAVSNYVEKHLSICFPTDTGNPTLLHVALLETIKALASVNRVKFRNIIKMKPEKMDSIRRTKKHFYNAYSTSYLSRYYTVDISKPKLYILPTIISIVQYLVPESKTDTNFFDSRNMDYKINISAGLENILKLENRIFGISRDDLFNLCDTDLISGNEYYIDKDKISGGSFDLMKALQEKRKIMG